MVDKTLVVTTKPGVLEAGGELLNLALASHPAHALDGAICTAVQSLARAAELNKATNDDVLWGLASGIGSIAALAGVTDIDAFLRAFVGLVQAAHKQSCHALAVVRQPAAGHA